MEENKTIFHYLSEVLIIFSVAVVSMMIFAVLFGEDAKEISTMFQLGQDGLAITVLGQLLVLAVVITIIKYLLFSATIVKHMPVIARMSIMLVAMISLIALLAGIFGWFPLNRWEPWVSFMVCFICYFMASLGVMALKTRAENKKLEQALRRYQEEGREDHEKEDRNTKGL